MTNWDDAILVGVVARTHGNKGEVAVNAETDFPAERFKQGARLWSRAKDGSLDTLEVATMRMHQGRPLILFKGIGSMNDAELLAGRELRIAETEGDADLLDAGEYFHRDLIGCAVVTESGDPVGEVTAVEGDRGNTRLVVKSRAERSADSAGRRDLHGGRGEQAHYRQAAGRAARAERGVATAGRIEAERPPKRSEAKD